jgi:hypothetical protein
MAMVTSKDVHEVREIAPALRPALAIANTGKSAVIDVWVDRNK